MSQTVFVQEGEIDYTPSVDTAAGAVVVQNGLVGVTRQPIPANTLGSLAVEGVFDFPKATGGGTGIVFGKDVFWDAGNSVATETAAGNTYIGKTVKAAADADATVRVSLEGTVRAANVAAAAAQTQDALTDSTGGTPGTTLAAITAGAEYAQADMAAVKNALASFAAQLAKVKADVAAVRTAANGEIAAMKAAGLQASS